jgi:hypothetical protein
MYWIRSSPASFLSTRGGRIEFSISHLSIGFRQEQGKDRFDRLWGLIIGIVTEALGKRTDRIHEE